VDFTIADFVADVRAPTPSAAAEIAVSDNRESRKYFTTYVERFSGAIGRYFENIQYRYQWLIKRNALKRPLRMLLESYQHRDELEERARRNLEITLQQKFSRLSAATSKLNALSPLSVLARGYGVITLDNGAAVRSSRQIAPGSIVKLQFFEGTAGANIISTDQESKDGIAF
jgi:exodeoxyribonuclease VII large subunit